MLCADRSSGPLLPDVTMAEIDSAHSTQLTVLSSQYSAAPNTQLTALISSRYSAHSTHQLTVPSSQYSSVHSTQLTVLSSQYSAHGTQFTALSTHPTTHSPIHSLIRCRVVGVDPMLIKRMVGYLHDAQNQSYLLGTVEVGAVSRAGSRKKQRQNIQADDQED